MSAHFQPPVWYENLPSTNGWLVDRVHDGVSPGHGAVVAARVQSAGRGRRGRAWQSAAGNLACSFLYARPLPPDRVATLSLAAALGVADLLCDLGLDARTKWPNDVLVGGRKIAGILAEGVENVEERPEYVVGIGLNVNLGAAALERIDRPATSVALETGARHDVPPLLDSLLVRLARRLSQWEAGGFAALRADWMARCVWIGERVIVREGALDHEGVLEGFGEGGQLVLRLQGDKREELWSGDLLRQA